MRQVRSAAVHRQLLHFRAQLCPLSSYPYVGVDSHNWYGHTTSCCGHWRIVSPSRCATPRRRLRLLRWSWNIRLLLYRKFPCSQFLSHHPQMSSLTHNRPFHSKVHASNEVALRYVQKVKSSPPLDHKSHSLPPAIAFAYRDARATVSVDHNPCRTYAVLSVPPTKFKISHSSSLSLIDA